MGINRKGRLLVEFLEEKGWRIMNGCTRGDEKGEFTFTGGRGNTIIDYVIGEVEAREKVGNLRIGERIDSDHHPVEVSIKGEKQGEVEIESKKRNGPMRGVWSEEGRELFKEK